MDFFFVGFARIFDGQICIKLLFITIPIPSYYRPARIANCNRVFGYIINDNTVCSYDAVFSDSHSFKHQTVITDENVVLDSYRTGWHDIIV